MRAAIRRDLARIAPVVALALLLLEAEGWVRGGWPGLGPALGVLVAYLLVGLVLTVAGLALWHAFGDGLDR